MNNLASYDEYFSAFQAYRGHCKGTVNQAIANLGNYFDRLELASVGKNASKESWIVQLTQLLSQKYEIANSALTALSLRFSQVETLSGSQCDWYSRQLHRLMSQKRNEVLDACKTLSKKFDELGNNNTAPLEKLSWSTPSNIDPSNNIRISCNSEGTIVSTYWKSDCLIYQVGEYIGNEIIWGKKQPFKSVPDGISSFDICINNSGVVVLALQLDSSFFGSVKKPVIVVGVVNKKSKTIKPVFSQEYPGLCKDLSVALNNSDEILFCYSQSTYVNLLFSFAVIARNSDKDKTPASIKFLKENEKNTKIAIGSSSSVSFNDNGDFIATYSDGYSNIRENTIRYCAGSVNSKTMSFSFKQPDAKLCAGRISSVALSNSNKVYVLHTTEFKNGEPLKLSQLYNIVATLENYAINVRTHELTTIGGVSDLKISLAKNSAFLSMVKTNANDRTKIAYVSFAKAIPVPILASVFTVSFCGTSCTRDEGEKTRIGGGEDFDSDKNIYCSTTGYIPVRIHKEISRDLAGAPLSCTVRGVGQNDWGDKATCDPLASGPLEVPKDLRESVETHSAGDQRSTLATYMGHQAPALAVHGANMAIRSGARQFNFLGHSRGAVECIMAAWFIYAYGDRTIPINIFAIDPVPGPGDWYGIFTQLPPNVVNFVGVYAWDHLDHFFTTLVPRPNARMTGSADDRKLEQRSFEKQNWKNLADARQLPDPLDVNDRQQPDGYQLYACRGRHGTVAGIATSDGQYDANKVSANVKPVPELVYKLARAYLAQWGTIFVAECAVKEGVRELRQRIHTNFAKFDAMGNGAYRQSRRPNRPYVRQVSPILGRLFWDTYYLEDVVGDPPFRLSYPVTPERKGGGWVKWMFL